MQVKYIKILFVLLLLFVSSSTIIAQTDAYTGTWEYQNGNQKFIVSLWEENDAVLGYYKKITVDNSGIQTSLIFTSRTDLGDGTYFFPYSIYGHVGQSGLTAIFNDNTMTNIDEDYKKGYLNMKIIEQGLPGCNTCITKASWKITDTGGMYINFVEGFSVPTNIILTKVSNTVNLD